jgi:DDE superfamily endonuclease
MSEPPHAHVDRAPHTRLLAGFRHAFYECLTSWGDSLFELCDAVLCSPSPVGSIPSLSLESVFRRSHGSLYTALARGDIDTDRLRRLLLASLPAHRPRVFAVDASTWDRCDAETSPERGFYDSASKHSAGQPIVAGWSYQWISRSSSLRTRGPPRAT